MINLFSRIHSHTAIARIFILLLCVFYFKAPSTCLAQRQLDPLEWISSKQAIVIQVDSMADLKTNLAELELWDHEQVEVIRKFVVGENFQKLLKPSGLSFDIHNADLAQSLQDLSDKAIDKSACFTVKTSAKADVLSWMLALETDLESAEDLSLIHI